MISRKQRRKMRSLMFWLKASEDDVLSVFASLPNAKRVGSGDRQYVYIRGSRENRAVLIAHADINYPANSKIEPVYDPKTKEIKSANKIVGIGADDRAGCAILWRLRDSGHSLLIPNKEEGGCIGSKFLMEDKEMSEEINNHVFAIQFDRAGDSDLVFYHVGSDDFRTWCETQFSGYKTANGTGTDIKVLCTKMCGVNISIGYKMQHGTNECLNINHWGKTLDLARRVLSQGALPKFIRPENSFSNNNHQYIGYHSCYGQNQSSVDQQRLSHASYEKVYRGGSSYDISDPTVDLDVVTCILRCPKCNGLMDEVEWSNNGGTCVFPGCQTTFERQYAV